MRLKSGVIAAEESVLPHRNKLQMKIYKNRKRVFKNEIIYYLHIDKKLLSFVADSDIDNAVFPVYFLCCWFVVLLFILCVTQGPRRSDLQVRDAIGRAEGAAGASRAEQTRFWTNSKPSASFRCALCVHAGDRTSTWGASDLTSLTSDLTDLKSRKVLISPSFFLRAHCLLSVLRLVLAWRLVQSAERVIEMRVKRRSSHFFFIPSKTNTSMWRKTSGIAWTGE